MTEYISREALLAEIAAEHGNWIVCNDTDELYCQGVEDNYSDTIRLINDIPAADVQSVNQWISCKDNMPDTLERGLSTMYSDCCLVCDAFGWVGMAYYITDGKKSWWEFADAQNKNKVDWTEVTHWMPLPEPPKDGDTE